MAIHQIWPTNPSGTFAFENYIHTVNDYYFLPAGIKQVKLKGYSDDADHDHVIQYAFTISRPEIAFPMLYGPIAGVKEIAAIMKTFWPENIPDQEGIE